MCFDRREIHSNYDWKLIGEKLQLDQKTRLSLNEANEFFGQFKRQRINELRVVYLSIKSIKHYMP